MEPTKKTFKTIEKYFFCEQKNFSEMLLPFAAPKHSSDKNTT